MRLPDLRGRDGLGRGGRDGERERRPVISSSSLPSLARTKPTKAVPRLDPFYDSNELQPPRHLPETDSLFASSLSVDKKELQQWYVMLLSFPPPSLYAHIASFKGQ